MLPVIVFRLPAQKQAFGDERSRLVSRVRPHFFLLLEQLLYLSVIVCGMPSCLGLAEKRTQDTETAGPSPVRRFEAHVDGSAVTAIHWD